MARGFALTIGLLEVDPDRYAGWPGIMHVCDADARDMAQLLGGGFSCKTLITAEARRAAVIAHIRHVAQAMVAGDLFVLFYSGHGSFVPDLDSDEKTQSDQTWCLYDGQLIDDELYGLWAQFAPGTRIVVLSDSCYSGSIIKQVAMKVEGEVAGGLLKAIPPDIARNTYEADKTGYDEILAPFKEKDPRKEVKARVILISACEEHTEAREGPVNSVFTAALKRVWNNGSFHGSYDEFRQAIEKAITNGQVPMLDFAGMDIPSLAAEQVFRI